MRAAEAAVARTLASALAALDGVVRSPHAVDGALPFATERGDEWTIPSAGCEPRLTPSRLRIVLHESSRASTAATAMPKPATTPAEALEEEEEEGEEEEELCAV